MFGTFHYTYGMRMWLPCAFTLLNHRAKNVKVVINVHHVLAGRSPPELRDLRS